jgi:hypothetical protein
MNVDESSLAERMALDDIHHHVQKALDELPDQAVLDIVFVGDMSIVG